MRCHRLVEVDPAGHRDRPVGGKSAGRCLEQAETMQRDLAAEEGVVLVETDEVDLDTGGRRELRGELQLPKSPSVIFEHARVI